MLNLSFNSGRAATATVQGPTLRRIIGGYELGFNIIGDITHRAPEPEFVRYECARVAISAMRKFDQPTNWLGLARPTQPAFIELDKYSYVLDFAMPIGSAQLEALEERRGGGDLVLRLLLYGGRSGEHGWESAQHQLEKRVPASQWMEMLEREGVTDAVLIEVDLPVHGTNESSRAAKAIRAARKYYNNGDYPACVAKCRDALDNFKADCGFDGMGLKEFMERHAQALREMTKADRDQFLLHAVRHSTHLAKHAEADGGTDDYSRRDAKRMLTMTALLVSTLA